MSVPRPHHFQLPYHPKKKQWSNMGEVGILPRQAGADLPQIQEVQWGLQVWEGMQVYPHMQCVQSPIPSHVVVQESGGVSNQ